MEWNSKYIFDAVIIAIVAIVTILLLEYVFAKKEINTIGVVAYKKFVPIHHPSQTHYAFIVVRGEKHWLFRVPQKTFDAYDVEHRIRMATYTGRLSGHTYQTTIHQPNEYVSK